MELKKLNQSKTIGLVDTFFPDDEVSFLPETFDAKLVAEALQSLGSPLGAPLVTFGTVKPAHVTGAGIHSTDNPNPVKYGDSFLLVQVDGGPCYVIAPRKED
jgi:hypothetical protein